MSTFLSDLLSSVSFGGDNVQQITLGGDVVFTSFSPSIDGTIGDVTVFQGSTSFVPLDSPTFATINSKPQTDIIVDVTNLQNNGFGFADAYVDSQNFSSATVVSSTVDTQDGEIRISVDSFSDNNFNLDGLVIESVNADVELGEYQFLIKFDSDGNGDFTTFETDMSQSLKVNIRDLDL